MKGTLTKKEQGWYVTYGSAAGREIWPVSIPLHPKQDELYVVMILNVPVCEFEGKEVEFDIVSEYTDKHTNQVQKYAKLIAPQSLDDFQTKPGFVEKRMEQMLEITAREEFKNVGDEGLFPNHTDKDIWIAGFKAGFKYKDR
jgi:hypothetical protein